MIHTSPVIIRFAVLVSRIGEKWEFSLIEHGLPFRPPPPPPPGGDTGKWGRLCGREYLCQSPSPRNTPLIHVHRRYTHITSNTGIYTHTGLVHMPSRTFNQGFIHTMHTQSSNVGNVFMGYYSGCYTITYIGIKQCW